MTNHVTPDEILLMDLSPPNITGNLIEMQSITRVTIIYNGNGHTGGLVPAGHVINTPNTFIVRGSESMVRTNHHFTGWRYAATGQTFLTGQVIRVTGHAQCDLMQYGNEV